LPVEICEAIMDEADERKGRFLDRRSDDQHVWRRIIKAQTSLSECSLTCRAWRPHVRYVLYSQPYFHSERSLQQFVKTLHRSPEMDVLTSQLVSQSRILNQNLILPPTLASELFM
ncbi:hypothetical protein C8Q77DRAFT_1046607, partial [Trametes polyzona]